MLILSRKLGESIVLHRQGQPPIEVMVTEIRREKVKLGISAASDVKVLRNELETRGDFSVEFLDEQGGDK